MKGKHNIITGLIAVALIAVCCDSLQDFNMPSRQAEIALPGIPFKYNVAGTTDHLPTLGRVLFYDPRLSINNAVSCARCHKQALAFSDDAQFSRGFENLVTPRNSMPIQNIVSNMFRINPVIPDQPDTIFTQITIFPSADQFPGGYLPVVLPAPIIITVATPVAQTPVSEVEINTDFFFTPTTLFWDGRENELETMVMKPIVNHIEMGIHDLKSLASKLRGIPDYPPLFMNAFGENDITESKIAKGLSAFLLSIRSTKSKFDQVVAGTAQLSAMEEEGRQLFFDKFDCNACHQTPGFSNIGLEASAHDVGFAATSGSSEDAGKFKIPSLRNIGVTAPYMHDGRFATLEKVLDHYSSGIKDNPNLDNRLKTPGGEPKRLNISPSEKRAVIAFLHTLTDHRMITDPKFSSPFVLR